MIAKLFNINYWFVYPGLLLLCLLVDRLSNKRFAYNAKCALFILLFMFIGYIFVYAGSPSDLVWQIRFSAPRLFTQLWPIVIFSVFLLLHSFEAAKRD